MFVDENFANDILSKMKSHKYGKDSAIIGEVVKDGKGKVFVTNSYGGTRIVDMLMGEQLPRIC
jgi:hydrogenase expression/formation protein HypE